MPSATEGHRKRPRSNRFENRHIPWPSCQTTLIRSPRRPRKTNRWAIVRITLQRLLDQQGQTVEALAHIGVPGRQPDAGRCSGTRSSTAQNVEYATESPGIDTRVDPHMATAAKIDLDQARASWLGHASGAASRRPAVATTSGAAIITGIMFGTAASGTRTCPPPRKQHARRNVVAARHFRHLGARLEAFRQDPHLLVARPSPPPLDNAQYFDPASKPTLRLALRSDAERSAIAAARRPSPGRSRSIRAEGHRHETVGAPLDHRQGHKGGGVRQVPLRV